MINDKRIAVVAISATNTPVSSRFTSWKEKAMNSLHQVGVLAQDKASAVVSSAVVQKGLYNMLVLEDELHQRVHSAVKANIR